MLISYCRLTHLSSRLKRLIIKLNNGDESIIIVNLRRLNGITPTTTLSFYWHVGEIRLLNTFIYFCFCVYSSFRVRVSCLSLLLTSFFSLNFFLCLMLVVTVRRQMHSHSKLVVFASLSHAVTVFNFLLHLIVQSV